MMFRSVTMVVILLLASQMCNGQPTDDPGSSDDLFYFRPDTPSRQIRGAILAEKLDRPGLAQGYLNDLMSTQPTPDQLMALRQEFGIGTFLKMSATQSLQPAARELLKLINGATVQTAASADTVALLISELGQSPQQTLAASLRILSAENAAVEPLLSADLSSEDGRLAALLLAKNARRFRYGLLNALPEADESRKIRILKLLGTTAARDLELRLLRYRFADSPAVAAAAETASTQLLQHPPEIHSGAEAVQSLLDEALTLITAAGKRFPLRSDRLKERQLEQRLSMADTPQPYGALFLKYAVTLVDDAAAINPDDQRVVAAQLVSQLTEQAWPAAWPQQAASFSFEGSLESAPPDIEVEAMAMALNSANSAAILSLLSRFDTSVPVLKHHPGLLRKSLLMSDARVRLLTVAVAKAGGASDYFIRDTVAAAVTGSDSPEAVVIDSRRGDSLTAAAVLTDLKFETQAAISGQSGFLMATDQLQCELILVHSNCLRWSLSDTLANLRADYRTRNTPIVIFGPTRDESNTEMARATHPGVWFVPEPISEITLADSLTQAGVSPPALSSEERSAMIRFARSLR